MNIYQPYEELADKSDVLHLKLSDARDRMLFVTYRAIPIGLTLMVWYILQQKRAEIPMGFNYTLIGVSVALIVWLFFRSYTCEIKIAAGKIFLLRKTITGVKEINMDVQDVDYIRLLVRRGRGGSARFILHTKQNKKVTILHIPLVWLNDRHTTLIAETLQQLTGAEIKRA